MSVNKDTVQEDSSVDIVFANTSRAEIKLHPSNPIGYFQLIDPAEGKQIDDTILAEIFGNLAGEPKEPPRVAFREPTKEELTFLDESINIQAPDPWATTYREMLYRYHDVISKGKFNPGWTDVVEHKIDLTDDNPVHIRQFRIPLEHRQTISLVRALNASSHLWKFFLRFLVCESTLSPRLQAVTCLSLLI